MNRVFLTGLKKEEVGEGNKNPVTIVRVVYQGDRDRDEEFAPEPARVWFAADQSEPPCRYDSQQGQIR